MAVKSHHKKTGPRTPWQLRTRYQRGRCVERLKPNQIESLAAADAFAGRLNAPLNGFLTVKFSEREHPLQEFQAATKRFSQWLRRWGGELHWIYVWEAIGGFHLHALIHIPHNSWQLFAEAIVTAFSGHDTMLKRRYAGPSMMAYLCKGTDWATHSQLSRQTRIKVKAQGSIAWKRCGSTENISPAARRKAQIICTQTYTAQTHVRERPRAIVNSNKHRPPETPSYVVFESPNSPLEAACGAAHITQAPASTPDRIVSTTLDPCVSMGHEKTDWSHERQSHKR